MGIRIALLFHLVGFAAYLGAGFAQTRFIASSTRADLRAEVRDAHERLAATIASKIELPAIYVAIASGIAFLALEPGLLGASWLQAKLVCVAGLFVLSHVEMMNAQRIVRARADGTPAEEIDQLKKRHGLFGTVGTLLLVAVVLLVTVLRF